MTYGFFYPEVNFAGGKKKQWIPSRFFFRTGGICKNCRRMVQFYILFPVFPSMSEEGHVEFQMSSAVLSWCSINTPNNYHPPIRLPEAAQARKGPFEFRFWL